MFKCVIVCVCLIPHSCVRMWLHHCMRSSLCVHGDRKCRDSADRLVISWSCRLFCWNMEDMLAASTSHTFLCVRFLSDPPDVSGAPDTTGPREWMGLQCATSTGRPHHASLCVCPDRSDHSGSSLFQVLLLKAEDIRHHDTLCDSDLHLPLQSERPPHHTTSRLRSEQMLAFGVCAWLHPC